MQEYTLNYVDVTEVAAGTGFGIYGCPVGIEPVVWEECVEWTDLDTEVQDYQEQDARLWDILFVGGAKLQMYPNEILQAPKIEFQIHCLLRYTTATEAVPIMFSIEKALLNGTPGLIIKYADDQEGRRSVA